MLDIESMAMGLLQTALPDVSWTVGFPQRWGALPCGCIVQNENAVRLITSTDTEKLTDITVQIQVFTAAPEQRSTLESAVDAVLTARGLRRDSTNHMTDSRTDGIPIFRSILLFSGVYDHTDNRFYH